MKKLILSLTAAGGAFVASPQLAWKDHLGGLDSAQYSAVSQIDRANILRVEQAWFYPAGDNGFRFGNQIWKMRRSGGNAVQVTNNGAFAVFESPPKWRVPHAQDRDSGS